MTRSQRKTKSKDSSRRKTPELPSEEDSTEEEDADWSDPGWNTQEPAADETMP